MSVSLTVSMNMTLVDGAFVVLEACMHWEFCPLPFT